MNRSLSLGNSVPHKTSNMAFQNALPMENTWGRRHNLSSIAWWERPKVLDLEKLQTLPLSCYLTLSKILAL